MAGYRQIKKAQAIERGFYAVDLYFREPIIKINVTREKYSKRKDKICHHLSSVGAASEIFYFYLRQIIVLLTERSAGSCDRRWKIWFRCLINDKRNKEYFCCFPFHRRSHDANKQLATERSNFPALINYLQSGTKRDEQWNFPTEISSTLSSMNRGHLSDRCAAMLIECQKFCRLKIFPISRDTAILNYKFCGRAIR